MGASPTTCLRPSFAPGQIKVGDVHKGPAQGLECPAELTCCKLSPHQCHTTGECHS